MEKLQDIVAIVFCGEYGGATIDVSKRYIELQIAIICPIRGLCSAFSSFQKGKVEQSP